ncbi:asparagine synthase-related protein [Salinarimonas rosea]|uniref:asparagine synthase-related protein n=1 Tax=Salinarimonas rosea TaxID=552063 RepID=UPI00041FFD93|nr:asparagine synthase-related protein [Salinarimonas rosea]
MSAIAVALRARNPGAGAGSVEAMLGAMAHRGANAHAFESGDACLGARWRGTPTGRPGAVRLRPDGPILCADMRLDDAAGLARDLGRPPGSPDAVLALAAYERWGCAFAEHLEGDFAIVVWDPARRELIGARDRFGVKPFFYHVDADAVLVASEGAAILAGLDAEPEIDDVFVAQYLTGWSADAARTAHRGLSRLEPGHLLRVGPDGAAATRRYWSLVPTQEEPADARDDGERLRALLEEAVAVRLRGTPTGVMLSGGLDSSALACIGATLRPQPLPVFSMRFADHPELDEGAHIEAVLAAHRFEPHALHLSAPDAVEAGREIVSTRRAPAPAPGLVFTRALYGAAAEAGLGALVNGHGGDEVISDGFARLDELARAGRWRALWRACGEAAPLYGDPRTDLFLARIARSAPAPFVRALARRLRGGRARHDAFAWRRLLSPEAARRTNIVERIREGVARPVAGHDEATRLHVGSLTAPRIPEAFEVLDEAAARAGIEPRYPFFDRRVIAFCTSRPAAAKLAGGRTRALLRDAMRGILPDSVRLRRTKADFLPMALAALRRPQTRAFLAALLERPGDIAAHVAMDVLREHVHALERGRADSGTAFALWRVIQLALWLETPAAVPARPASGRPAPARPAMETLR